MTQHGCLCELTTGARRDQVFGEVLILEGLKSDAQCYEDIFFGEVMSGLELFKDRLYEALQYFWIDLFVSPSILECDDIWIALEPVIDRPRGDDDHDRRVELVGGEDIL
jgi:hypothetical protein